VELQLSSEDAAFRDEVRGFIAENYPNEMRVPNPETDLSKEQMLLWHRILHNKGWIAPLWPKQYGGPGWSITQRFLFERETTRAGTLPPLAFSVTMVGPVIYTFGNAAQKQKFLPRILSGQDWWCQGYSEPGSGSDLASVRTRAVREGDHAMAELNAVTLEYAKTRKQFGAALGSFQVLQHRMVDMFIAHQEAISLMQHLSLSLVTKEPGGSKLASGAKSKIGYAAKFIAEQAVQLHGGMGMSDELNVGHYFKRISSFNIQFGDPAFHILRYARQN
jgi:alkylation response protein AidB-like acyl-CoA dehydrogenase